MDAPMFDKNVDNEYRELYLLHEFRFKAHRADTVDLAVDVVIAFGQADVPDLGADLDNRR